MTTPSHIRQRTPYRKNTRVIQIRVTPEQLDEIDKLAVADNRSLAGFALQMVQLGVTAHKQEKGIPSSE